MVTVYISTDDLQLLLEKYLSQEIKILSENETFTAIYIDPMNLKHLETLAQLILDIYEPRIIQQIISRDFFYKGEDVQTLMRYVRYFLDHSEDWELIENIERVDRRKNLIMERLSNYFTNHKSVHLEGFFMFRFKDYMEECYSIVERAVDEYLMDKEYQEFIQHLQYFVKNQQEKIGLIHVLHFQDRQFFLYDHNYKPYQTRETDSLIKELMDQNIHYEDLIVTTLITLAPRKIILHSGEEKHHIIKTLKNVYGDRIQICIGCPRCREWLDELKPVTKNKHRYTP